MSFAPTGTSFDAAARTAENVRQTAMAAHGLTQAQVNAIYLTYYQTLAAAALNAGLMTMYYEFSKIAPAMILDQYPNPPLPN
jgi:hypothetical protein